jgi:hypothetical protein
MKKIDFYSGIKFIAVYFPFKRNQIPVVPARNFFSIKPMSLKEARAMRGSGWIGNLGEMRSSRFD